VVTNPEHLLFTVNRSVRARAHVHARARARVRARAGACAAGWLPRLAGWLADRLSGRPAGWLAGCFRGCLADCLSEIAWRLAVGEDGCGRLAGWLPYVTCWLTDCGWLDGWQAGWL
jgi:hypothetical protein